MKRSLLIGLLAMNVLNLSAQLTPGSLDPAFAGKGWKTIDVVSGNYYDDINVKSLLQPDGKIVLLNYVYAYCYLVRYNTDGSLDSVYGANGYTMPVAMYPEDAILQPDGKVVISGEVRNPANGVYDIALARFNTNGLVDTTFGNNGIAMLEMIDTRDYALSLAIQPDGKIVTAGMMEHIGATNVRDILLARFNADGSVDTNFGNSTTYPGTVVTDITNDDRAEAVAIQPADNRILIGGYTIPGSMDYNFTVARYTSAGIPDSSFGGTGIVNTDFRNSIDVAHAMVLQSDGKIVLAGTSNCNGADNMGIVRYNTNGSLDAAFGGTGTITADFFGEYDQVNAITIMGSGQYLVATGFANYGGQRDLAVISYNISDGALNTSFGAGTGKLTFPLNATANDVGESIAVDSYGEILIGGDFINSTAGNKDYGILKLTNGGAPDGNFNLTGVLTARYPVVGSSTIGAITVDNGKVLIAGTYKSLGGTRSLLALTRWNDNGTIDNSFGSNGAITADFGYNVTVTGVGVQSNGRIVVGGFVNNDFLLFAATSTGTVDNSFGTNGKVITDFTSTTDEAYALVIQPDDKIVLGGQTFGTSRQFALARYTPTGTLDVTFDGDGKVITDFAGNSDMCFSLALQPDGKIIAGGNSNNGSTDYFALARYSGTDGSLDASFGNGGLVTTTILPGNYIESIAIQSDNKIVAGGYGWNNAESNFEMILARYTTDGSLDPSFDTDGIVITDIGGLHLDEGIMKVAVQSDQKIDAAVIGTLDAFGNTIGVARYLTGGSLDTQFGNAGTTLTYLGIASNITSGAWYQGRMYVSGEASDVLNNQHGILAAYYTGGETPPPVVTVPTASINDASVAEGATATLTVTLSGTSTRTILITYSTRDNVAVSKGKNADFRATKGTLTYAPGETVKYIAVVTRLDKLNEPAEDFYVDLGMGRKMTEDIVKITNWVGTVTITNSAPGIMADQWTVDESARKNNNRQEISKGRLIATAFPNPSNTSFMVQLQSDNSAPANIRVMDISGRLIETKTGVSANGRLPIGANYKPGVYYAEVTQANEKVMLKLVKQ